MYRICAFLILAACSASGSDMFRYYVFDETKTDKLHYEQVHDFTIYDFADKLPHVMFYTAYRIYGCAQDSFTYTVERCERDIPRDRYNKLLAAVREIPLKALQPKEWPERSHGWLELDGTDNMINARLADRHRAKLHALILTFLDELVPKAERKASTRTIEGDLWHHIQSPLRSCGDRPTSSTASGFDLPVITTTSSRVATSDRPRTQITRNRFGLAVLLLSRALRTHSASTTLSLPSTALSTLALAVIWVLGRANLIDSRD